MECPALESPVWPHTSNHIFLCERMRNPSWLTVYRRRKYAIIQPHSTPVNIKAYSTVDATKTVVQIILRSSKILCTQGSLFCTLGLLFCALMREGAISTVYKRFATEGFACTCKENIYFFHFSSIIINVVTSVVTSLQK